MSEYSSIKLEHMIDMWVKKSQKFTKVGWLREVFSF